MSHDETPLQFPEELHEEFKGAAAAFRHTEEMARKAAKLEAVLADTLQHLKDGLGIVDMAQAVIENAIDRLEAANTETPFMEPWQQQLQASKEEGRLEMLRACCAKLGLGEHYGHKALKTMQYSIDVVACALHRMSMSMAQVDVHRNTR